MRRSVVVGVIFTAIFMSGCSGSSESEQRNNKEQEAVTPSTSAKTATEIVPGYTGGCKKGFTIYSQNQFTGSNGGYGALVRRTLDAKAESAGLGGGDELEATGWFVTGELIYPDNPAGIRGEVWYYVPDLPNGGAGWVADAGVRAVKTTPAPGDDASFYKPKTQAAPQPPECELKR